MIRQFELVERVQSYDPDADEDMLNRAYVYGLKKHGTQLRASGDPYFSHPVEVAGSRCGAKPLFGLIRIAAPVERDAQRIGGA